MTRPTTSARGPRGAVLAVLAALLAVALAACTIERATPQRTGTETTAATDTSAAPDTTAAPRAAAKPGEARGAAVTIVFGGDVHFEGAIGRRLARDPETTVGPIATVLRQADLAMVNLETAVTERGTPAAKEFTFRAPPSAFTALAAAGIDAATMANNHGMDYGLSGLRDSLAAARAARFPVVGIGRDAAEAFVPLRLEAGGWRVAVLGATQVLDAGLAAAWSAGDGKPGLASAQGGAERLLAAVAAARRSADTVVVFLHWGQELARCPLARQRALAQALVEAGADVIVGSHAHVLLGGGRLGGAYVAYGLGNFVFTAASAATTASGVLELTVRGRSVERAAWHPARIRGGVARPLDGPAAARALDEWQSLRGCTGLAPGP